MKYDILLSNPVIVLPESLHTNRVIVADLGQLTVSNEQSKHPVSGQGECVLSLCVSMSPCSATPGGGGKGAKRLRVPFLAIVWRQDSKFLSPTHFLASCLGSQRA